MNYEEFMKYVDKMDNNIRKKLKDNEEELTFYSQLVISLNAICEENQKQKEVIDKAIRMLEIQIEVIKEQPSDNSANDNMEIKQREMVIRLLKEVSE